MISVLVCFSCACHFKAILKLENIQIWFMFKTTVGIAITCPLLQLPAYTPESTFKSRGVILYTSPLRFYIYWYYILDQELYINIKRWKMHVQSR